jgi:hypothetical protein
MYGSADFFSLLFGEEMERTRWPHGHSAIVVPGLYVRSHSN